MTKPKPTPLSQILSLARAGSPGRAWALFVEEGWDRETSDPKALTLKGRLLKDRAKASSGTDRIGLYGEAAAAYAAAADIRTDSYPLINAAALALLGGKPERSAELAGEVLALIENNPDEGENAYWRGATRAEALLLLGKETEARAALSDAIAKLPHAWEDHAATIGQFALILAEQDRDAAWLDRFRPPPSIHFSGVIRLQQDDTGVRDAIEQSIDQIQPGFAYGALAAGSDILFAQAFLKHAAKWKTAAELHIILPFPVDQFRDLSIRPFGGGWLPLFDAVIEQAATVNILGRDDPPLTLAVDMADKVAMGQALRNARNLQSNAKAVTVIGEGEKHRPVLARWRDAGRDLITLEGHRHQTLSGEFAPEESTQTLGTMLWVNNADPDALHQISGQPSDSEADWHATASGTWSSFADLDTGYAAARTIAMANLAGDLAGAQIGLLHDIMDIADPSPETLKRAELFAGVSKPGVVTTNHSSAMALTLLNAARSIEEIGELKTSWGSQSLWRII